MDLAIGVSAYNQRELDAAGYARTAQVPILIDWRGYDVPPDDAVLARWDRVRPLLLFVGRVSPHKRQDDLIRMLAYYRACIDPNARLVLVGASLGGIATGKSTVATTQSAERAEPTASANPCRAQIGGFLDSMNALRARLEVGLGYEDYIAEVGRVRAAYDRLPTARLELDCLIQAGTPAEKAFNEYIAAANVWGECLAEAGCGAASIERRLQAEWRVASRFLSAARRR